jgi:hypothetical protein
MSALSESHVGRYTEHNTKPNPHRHLVSCRTDGCTHTDASDPEPMPITATPN